MDLKSYNKVSIYLLPLQWNGIEYNCADPIKALSPAVRSNEKFEQIHENKEAIIVDIEELQALEKLLMALFTNNNHFNFTLKHTHIFNKRLNRVSSEKTLEPLHGKNDIKQSKILIVKNKIFPQHHNL